MNKYGDEPSQVMGPENSRPAGAGFTLMLPGNVPIEYVWCPAGSFVMGSPESEVGRGRRENQHQVTLSRGFWTARFPTTQEQYSAVCGTNPSLFKGSNRPVERVDWYDAMEFCQRLSEITTLSRPAGFSCSLPTEAQWEYACRAGTVSALNNGLEITSENHLCTSLDPVAWYRFNSDEETHEVGQKLANTWGVFDMHGNVCEWCLDRFGYYSRGPVTDPVGATEGEFRVHRGGSWCFRSGICRSANRSVMNCSYSLVNLGFRSVLVCLG